MLGDILYISAVRAPEMCCPTYHRWVCGDQCEAYCKTKGNLILFSRWWI